MSTKKEELSVLIGGRLREEREKTGMSQDAISTIFGVSTKTWGKYERGVTTPDAAILSLLGTQCGLDVFYVLFGSRSKGVSDITDDEIELIKTYRAAPLMVKAAALAALTAGSSASNAINVSGKGNRVAGRDYNEKK
ncbi:helix-turn-helix transcriptional regulator [Salmonella enterica subsp. enterica serovar Louisiana]|nr:XRE family transcriptional regulator [Salmonella enterica subsp. enterica serovar Lomalinda]ECI5766503.1 XRE family transcriptional regulator [Salmonella enterica subsp. enterica]EGC8525993.1 helix-turn-helix transcriptional regulator [Salmonella enterica subsp. enterica serovar Louisiana]EHF9643860.1 helix-turn-helix transcriptional regulator [Salmonella enterica]EHV9882928.1 helix-turn-helix transcriptional regulator [Salmonella enterica subsp. enterica serovar Durham]EHW1156265.1 helix-t